MNCIYKLGSRTFLIPNVERSTPDEEEEGINMLEDERQSIYPEQLVNEIKESCQRHTGNY